MQENISTYQRSAANMQLNATGKMDKNIPFVVVFTRWSWMMLLLASLIQLAFFWEISNLFGVLMVNMSWFLFHKIILQKNILHVYPFSSFLILGFVATQFYIPIFATLLEGKLLVFNLDLPYQVFIHAFCTLLMLLMGHIVYRSISQKALNLSRNQLAKTALFKVPSETQLWSMGIMGLLAMFYIYFYSPSVGREATGVLDKFIQGFIPFTYAPFFIPFSKLYSGKEQEKSILPKLILFAIVLFIVSLGRNSRGGFMMGFTALGFSYTLGVLVGIFKFKAFSIKTVFFASALVYLLTGPLSDLATAMVLVRGQRSEVERTELIALTMEKYQDKEAINNKLLADKEEERDWDEQYINNPFMGRFSNLKYSDVGLAEAAKIKEGDMAMLEFSIDRLLATFPDPILKLFNINVDKQKVNSMSFGDYLHYRAGAGYSSLGGFRSGHFVGTGLASFGWYYLFILGIFMIPVFFLLDIFCYVIRSDNNAGYTLRFSLCGLLLLTSIFMFFPVESVVNIAAYLFRGWIQAVLLYILIFYITAYVSKFFKRKKNVHVIKK